MLHCNIRNRWLEIFGDALQDIRNFHKGEGIPICVSLQELSGVLHEWENIYRL
jgi:hypothetical protein